MRRNHSVVNTEEMHHFITASICISIFLIGSFPTGFLLVWLRTGEDIRTKGSGNIGATNVSRVLGKKWAVVVFLLDALKGFLPLYFLNRAGLDLPTLSWIAFMGVLGHCYSPWLKWNGGKGVAMAEGVLLALVPAAALLGLCVYVAVAWASGVSALGSLIALAATTVYVAVQQRHWLPLIAALGALLTWRHRSNFRHLFEPQATQKKRTSSTRKTSKGLAKE